MSSRSPSLIAAAVLCLAAGIVGPRGLVSHTIQDTADFGPQLQGRLLELAEVGLAFHEPHSVLEAPAGSGADTERPLRSICRELIRLPGVQSLTLRGEAHAGQTILAFLGRATEGAWVPEECGYGQVAAITRALVRSEAYVAARRQLERLVAVVAPEFLAAAPRPDADAYDDWLVGAERRALRRDIVTADLSWFAIALAASLPVDTQSQAYAYLAAELDALTTLHAALYELDRSARSLNALADGGTHLAALFVTSANALPHRNAAARLALARSAIEEVSRRFINDRDEDVRVSVLSHLIQLTGCRDGLASPRLIREWRAGLTKDTLLASPSVAVLSHAWRAWGVTEGSTNRNICFIV